jgi:cysteine synthase A
MMTQQVPLGTTDPEERRQLYSRLKKSIGNTPLIKLEGVDVGRNCKVFAKAEYMNPTGSHYDREMIRLLEWLETQQRVIQPGKTRMLETTTGNSGSAFAWLCRSLAYPPPTIVIPADMPRARRRQISSFGAELIESEAGEYISGIEKAFAGIYKMQSRLPPGERFFCPMHWNDEVHCVAGMEECGKEILAQIDEDFNTELDYFMFALGNGSSARGIGKVLDEKGVRLFGMEPMESPIVTELLDGTTGTQPRGARKHGILGTGPSEERQVYPNMREAAKLLEGIVLVSTEEAREMQTTLMDRAFLHLGMSSAACVVAIRKLVETRELRNQNIGTIFYDASWKYLD